ncbi:MAG TPA: malic enzyme-like NAD(P)-binding protein, partial [Dehalococcoidia bacterium]|nr:malic enzyme-like NAD(P)-binding protein [Dehalococcoidia bacterium]
MRLNITNRPGMLAQVAAAIGAEGGNIGAIDTPEISHDSVVRDITVAVENSSHGKRIVDAVKAISGVRVVNVSDPIMVAHLGGKIEITPKKPLRNRADLSTFYTPGVAGVSLAIHEDPQKVYALTMKGNTIAIVTDGTAVLGLGDIGPAAALPVMEGKSMLFKEFGAVDAVPICLATKDPGQIVDTVKYIAPGFGGVNLEDISAPRCFEVEERLRAELDIPVFHDDQHGTAVVVLAALINALQLVSKRLSDVKIVINGMGAAGISTARLLLVAGTRNIVGCDRAGILYRGRKENMNPVKASLAEVTNPDCLTGSLVDAIAGADIFIGVSGPDLLAAEAIGKMAREPIVFALANP